METHKVKHVRKFRIINSFQFNSIQYNDLRVYISYAVFSESPHPIFLLSIPSSWSELNIIILKRKYAFALSRWRNFVHLLPKKLHTYQQTTGNNSNNNGTKINSKSVRPFKYFYNYAHIVGNSCYCSWLIAYRNSIVFIFFIVLR